MTKGGEEGLGWVAEKKFGSETANCDISAADGVKEGSVGRGAKRAGDIGDERSIFEVGDWRVGLIEGAEIRGKGGCAWEGISGGCEGGGGGMWSRHTFSLARLEPTRTDAGSPGA